MDDNPTTTAPVDTAILRKAGLTESQAKGYLALIENGELSPVELAEKTGESRTNGYMICEKLAGLGLATKKEGQKALYTPNHPSALETLAEKRRKIVQRNEIEVKNSINPLIDLFFLHTEAPGTRTLQGIEGIKEVYNDTLRSKQDIYLFRTRKDYVDLGYDYMVEYRKKRAELGITTYALTPATVKSYEQHKQGVDETLNFNRVFFPDDSYTAPVEIDIYGDKVALISYGQTQTATIITSPTIALALREIFTLLRQQLAMNHDRIVSEIE